MYLVQFSDMLLRLLLELHYQLLDLQLILIHLLLHYDLLI